MMCVWGGPGLNVPAGASPTPAWKPSSINPTLLPPLPTCIFLCWGGEQDNTVGVQNQAGYLFSRWVAQGPTRVSMGKGGDGEEGGR